MSSLREQARKMSAKTGKSVSACRAYLRRRKDGNYTKRKYGEASPKNRRLIDKLKEAPCMDCHNTFPPECMDFDHRPGVKKHKTIASMAASSVNALLDEVAKCDLVCANCHRTRTRQRRSGRTAWPSETVGREVSV